MQVKKQQLEPDMEHQIDSKLGKEYVKAVYCHPAYLTSIHQEKRWAGRSTSWNQDCWEKYQSPQICRWHHPYGRKLRGTKKPLDESERGEWKSWLETRYSKNKDHGIWSRHSWQIDGETVETVADFILLGSKITADGDAAMKLKDTYSLEEKLWPTWIAYSKAEHYFAN